MLIFLGSVENEDFFQNEDFLENEQFGDKRKGFVFLQNRADRC